MIDEVLTAVFTRVQALALDLAGDVLPVRKAKQPVQEEGTGEAKSQITVSADSAPKVILRLSTIHDLYTYRVTVTYWTPGNRDNTANLPTLSAWENAIEKAFSNKPTDLLGIEDLRDVRSETAEFLDRASFTQGWDVSATDIELDLVVVRVRP